MIYKFKQVEIFYEFVGNESALTLVVLHGWGCSHKNLLFCSEYLKNYNLLYIDFPPFGESAKDLEGWTIFTYAHMVISLCEYLKIERYSLLGHSFGGRVAIIVSVLNKEKVEKLVLVDSAGIKPRKSLTRYISVCRYKIRKKRGKDVSKFGSRDYKNLDVKMKNIFCNIVNTHLEMFLPHIKAQTLVVFGKEDKTTPIYMARKLCRHIEGSKLCLLPDAGHFCFQDKKILFITCLQEFLADKKGD